MEKSGGGWRLRTLRGKGEPGMQWFDKMRQGRIRCLALFFLTYMAAQSLLRAVNLLTSLDMVSLAAGDMLRTFLAGLVYDTASGVFFTLPLALLLWGLPARWLNRKVGRALLFLVTFFQNGLMVFSLVALHLYWQEFHTNFNFIAVDYLVYTQEMIGQIRQSFPVEILLPGIFAVALALTGWEGSRFPCVFPEKGKRSCLMGALCLLLVPLLAVLVPQDTWREKISDNAYNVELAGNGPYGFVYAYFHNQLDYNRYYRKEDRNLVRSYLRQALRADNVTFTGPVDTLDVTRRVENHNALTDRRPNVVLITVESLSSDFMGTFHGEKDWTPNLDKLASQSLVFSRMYATGTRTVRGLEALALAVPPTPGQSILRRPDYVGLFTLGNALNQAGYQTDFLYGGYGYFDNMNAFYEGNDFAVHDRLSIPKEKIFCESVWGVADEILFDKVLETMDERAAKHEPTLEVVMTTSNHRPFRFPEGRVQAEQGSREGGVRYTDWAIQDFLEKARRKPWFANTVFVLVADHQAAAAGKMALPVHKYHIPCMIYAPGLIPAGVNDRLVSQIDLAPTLLGLLGVSYTSRFLGQDIYRTRLGQERIFISTYQSLGYIENNHLLILNPQQRVESYRILDWQKSRYEKEPLDPVLQEHAIAWYQGAYELYNVGDLKNPVVP